MFRMALALGCTVSELGQRMSSKELTEWMAYYDYEPWGSYIDGYRHALTASTIANSGLMMSNPKRLRTHPFKPEQFSIGLRKTSQAGSTQTWQQKKALLNKALGI